MKKQQTSGTYTDLANKVTFDIPVLAYTEKETEVIYAPSLDLFGYGKTEVAARESFILALEEFIRYTTHKKTIEKVLEQLGWKIKKHKFKAPSLDYMLKENEQFNEIFNQKDFKKYNEQIGMPIYA